jgi:hypothetical protein
MNVVIQQNLGRAEMLICCFLAGHFAIEVESISIVKGDVAEKVWPKFRPL